MAATPLPTVPDNGAAANELSVNAPSLAGATSDAPTSDAASPDAASPNAATSRSGERLQKLLARAGLSSRRAAEELIAAGRVSVNGHVITEPGQRADPSHDRITVDGQPLKLPTGPAIVLLMHKPTGVVTTRKDPEGRTTVTHLLPDKFKHLHPVGRLDYDTAGALLLTDDGSLTQLLTHPSHRVEKVYWARVKGHVSVATLKQLEAGVYLEDGKTAPCRARVRAQTEHNALIQLTLHEGRNRQVRRMMEAVGHPVRALRRVRVAGLGLEELLPGTFRQLLPGEVHALRKAAEGKGQKVPGRRPQAGIRKPSRQMAGGAQKEGGSGGARSMSGDTSVSRSAGQGVAKRVTPGRTKRATQDAATRATGAAQSKARPGTRPGATSNKTQGATQRATQHPVARRIDKKWAQQSPPPPERQWGRKVRPNSTSRVP